MFLTILLEKLVVIYSIVLTREPFFELNQFFTRFKPLSYRKRETILRPEDTPPGIFYIQKGFVRQYTISAEGKELTTIIYKPRDLFPIRWALTEIPLQSYFEAMTPVLLQRAPREEFLFFLKSEPDVFLSLTGRVINRLYAILERMEHLAFGNADNKVSSLLLLLAERFGKKKHKHVVIQLPLTHQDIASLLGITRETASISMKKLQDAGIVERQLQHLVVRSMRKLSQASAFSDN